MMFSSIKRKLKKKGRGTAEFSRANQPRQEYAVDRTEPICPHCNDTSEKMPVRKKTCQACNPDIHPKTRPADNVEKAGSVDIGGKISG